MAKIHRLTKGGQTIFPATTTDAVVHPGTRTSISKLFNEINVSVVFPAGGVTATGEDGGNRYTLKTAIPLVPSELRSTIGLKCSFISVAGNVETWEYQGGTFTAAGRWLQVGAGKLSELSKLEKYYNTKKYIRLNGLIYGTENPTISLVYDSFKTSFVWVNKTNPYCYLISPPITNLTSNFVISISLKNTSDRDYTMGLALSKLRDWSAGLFYYENVPIKSGETIFTNIYGTSGVFSSIIEGGISPYVLIILKGRGSANALNNDGSVEVTISYSDNEVIVEKSEFSNFADSADYAENAKRSITADSADYAISAGFVGCEVKNRDTLIRDVPPTGGIANTLTADIIDDKKVHIYTNENFTPGVASTRYRGIYWKIAYGTLEDLKDKIFSISRSASYTFRVHNVIGDWGPGTTTFLISTPNSFSLYDILIAGRERLGEQEWNKTYGQIDYVYISMLIYRADGMFNTTYNDIISISYTTAYTRVIASEFTKEAENRIIELTNDGYFSVACWGDSLTAGAGAGTTTNLTTVLNALINKGYEKAADWGSKAYPGYLKEMLGDRWIVFNLGVGGEGLNTIAARQGANTAYATNEFTLPADTSPVQIGTHSNKLYSSWETAVAPLLQGSGNSVNPCSVGGIDCTLRWTGTSHSDATGTYTLQRVSAGDRAVNFSTNVPIIMSGSKLYRDTKIHILWCWQNGGYSDNNELIEKLDKMIAHIDSKRYVIIGLHSGGTSRLSQEKALSKKYGDKFLNWREYISSNSLYDFDIEPTEGDLSSMAKGACPPSLLADSVHLNASGYAILAYKIAERFKDLGYIIS
ncbi:hypothetical protein [Phocaeicola sp.]